MVYKDRYIRQTTLPGFGPAAQEKLGAGKVLVVGLGGLGVPVIQYLASMGVGCLGLVDGDSVEIHNLQRQPLYHESDLGRSKVDCAGEYIARQNSQVRVRFHPNFLTKENALAIIREYDLVVDASDNFGTRYLVNDACMILDKPFIYGGLYGFEGQLSVLNLENGPTYRCLFPNPPDPATIPDCNERGVLGVLPGIIGTLQGLEAVKVLCNLGTPVRGELLLFDGLTMTFRKMKFERQAEERNSLEDSYDVPCVTAPEVDGMTVLNAREKACVLDVRSPKEFKEDHLPGSLHIPLHQLRENLDRLPSTKTYVVCQTGKRSAQAVRMLQQFFPEREYRSLSGGLDSLRATQQNTIA